MALNRIKPALAAALLACAVALLLAPARAQNQSMQGIPCRVSWDDTTHGGDWFTSQGDIELTQIAPQGDGSFVAIGWGQGTVTYHATGPCRDVVNPTWQAPYMVTIESDDGQTADVDIGTNDDEPHSVVVCPATGHFQYDVDAPEVPSIRVPLHEGSTPFSEDRAGDHGHAGHQGTVTLHYCTLDHPNGH